MSDSTKRFSSRVENYVKYRPTYPWAVVETLQNECQLVPTQTIADVGAGTGILTDLFLRNGNPVFAVEPNDEMRSAAERALHGYTNFYSVNGTAEATTLDDQSVDFVTAGQAFHWFDTQLARAEFTRILRPGGWVVLMWNYRRMKVSPFMAAYEELLDSFSLEYQEVGHQRGDLGDDSLRPFFGANECHIAVHPNQQIFDFAGLKGRLLSSSYAPEPGHPQYAAMIAKLEQLFATYQVGGHVIFEYDTRLYYGHLEQTNL